jgi:predicted CxxxxCH...CXXCH cytochrome family protein
VDGNITWNMNQANQLVGAGAAYKGSAAGGTGHIAGGAAYGSCSNVYCHSSGQASDGSATPNYATQLWGAATLACSSCHGDMINNGTGSHLAHTADAYTCVQCHGAGYVNTPGAVTAATHVDHNINMAALPGYAKGNTFATGLGYSTCTNNCHGRGTPAWGANLGSVQCQKCHADQNSATFFGTSGSTDTSDPHVGAHQGHVRGTLGYAGPIACASCHPTTAIGTTTHMNGTVEFNGANITSYDPATGNCTSYCHGSTLPTNYQGSNTTPSWKAGASYLSATPSVANCGTCHAFPPNSNSHKNVVVSDFASTVAQCATCHPSVNSNGTMNQALHMNGQADLNPGVTSGGGTDCSMCHNTSGTPLTYGMANDSTTYHHVLANSSPDYTGNTCLKCHVDHDISNPAFNSGNTLGVAANLRVDNGQPAPVTGSAPSTADNGFTNTDFVYGSTNGGICLSCHRNAQTKNLTKQKYQSPFINTTTMVVTQAQFYPSMHNYTTTSTFSKDGSKFVANCVKCHSDSMSENRQSGTKTFGLHISVTRELFATMGATTGQDAREDRLCFGCHSQKGQQIDAQTQKPVAGKDWYGSRTMRASAEDTFSSFSTSTRVFRHNVGKYTGLHKANENEAYLTADKHVECADCHNSHVAQFGNHSTAGTNRSTRANTLSYVLKGVTGVVPTYGGGSTLGLPGVSMAAGNKLYFDGTAVAGTAPTTKQTSATLGTGSTWPTQAQMGGMSATVPAGATPSQMTFTSGTVSGTYYGSAVFASPLMTNGSVLQAQTVTLNLYSYYATATSAPRLAAYAYLWNGTTKTALTGTNPAGGGSGNALGTSAGLQSFPFNIPQTTITNANTCLIFEVYVQGRATTAGTVYVNYNSSANQSSIAFSPSATWGAASSYTVQAATKDYQVCFKCHSGANTNVTGWGGSGSLAWTDLSIEFNPANKSFHPVMAPLNDASSGSTVLTASYLNNGWKPGDVMTCTDCHATDSTASKGPHGSSVKWMLAGVNKAWPYNTAAQNGASATPSTSNSYTLSTQATNKGTVNGIFCFNCHTITNTNPFHTAANGFSTHQGMTFACVNCHIRVPHGGKVSRLRTTTTAPARYLANGTSTSGMYVTKWGAPGSSPSGNFTCSGGTHSGGTETW